MLELAGVVPPENEKVGSVADIVLEKVTTTFEVTATFETPDAGVVVVTSGRASVEKFH